MNPVCATRVDVSKGIQLNPIWNPCVGIGENPSVGEYLCLRVYVKGISGFFVSIQVRWRILGAYTHIVAGTVWLFPKNPPLAPVSDLRVAQILFRS